MINRGFVASSLIAALFFLPGLSPAEPSAAMFVSHYDRLERAIGDSAQEMENQEKAPSAGDAMEPAGGGFEFFGGVTAIIQGTEGAASDETRDQTDASMTADLEMVFNQGGRYFLVMAMESGFGEGVNDNFPTDITPNYDVYETSFHPHQRQADVTLSQAYIEGLFLGARLVLNVGKMDVHHLYDTNVFASDETASFMAGALVRAAGVVSHELEAYYSPAVRVYFAPASWLELDAIYAHHDMEDLARDNFFVFQATLKPGIAGLEGNWRAYAAHDGRDYDSIDNGMRTDLILGASVDQYISENIGLFFRWSARDEEIADARVVSMISGGVVVSGGMWGRADDAFGAGYAELSLNEKLDLPYEGGQSVWEIYYNARVNGMISITPDVQLHDNLPRETDRSVTVYGVRAQVDF
ncbi:MAG: carbohydrate porin [Candidatus Nitrospinota bacterium M3_3B_026]